MIKKYVVRERSVVKLADDSTHVELPGYIRAQVVFTDHLGRDHVGGCKLRILGGGAKDLIIGLGSIRKFYLEFLWRN